MLSDLFYDEIAKGSRLQRFVSKLKIPLDTPEFNDSIYSDFVDYLGGVHNNRPSVTYVNPTSNCDGYFSVFLPNHGEDPAAVAVVSQKDMIAAMEEIAARIDGFSENFKASVESVFSALVSDPEALVSFVFEHKQPKFSLLFSGTSGNVVSGVDDAVSKGIWRRLDDFYRRPLPSATVGQVAHAYIFNRFLLFGDVRNEVGVEDYALQAFEGLLKSNRKQDALNAAKESIDSYIGSLLDYDSILKDMAAESSDKSVKMLTSVIRPAIADELEQTKRYSKFVSDCLLSENLDVGDLALVDSAAMLSELRAKTLGDLVKSCCSFADSARQVGSSDEAEVEVRSSDHYALNSHLVGLVKGVEAFRRGDDIGLADSSVVCNNAASYILDPNVHISTMDYADQIADITQAYKHFNEVANYLTMHEDLTDTPVDIWRGVFDASPEILATCMNVAESANFLDSSVAAHFDQTKWRDLIGVAQNILLNRDEYKDTVSRGMWDRMRYMIIRVHEELAKQPDNEKLIAIARAADIMQLYDSRFDSVADIADMDANFVQHFMVSCGDQLNDFPELKHQLIATQSSVISYANDCARTFDPSSLKSADVASIERRNVFLVQLKSVIDDDEGVSSFIRGEMVYPAYEEIMKNKNPQIALRELLDKINSYIDKCRNDLRQCNPRDIAVISGILDNVINFASLETNNTISPDAFTELRDRLFQMQTVVSGLSIQPDSVRRPTNVALPATRVPQSVSRHGVMQTVVSGLSIQPDSVRRPTNVALPATRVPQSVSRHGVALGVSTAKAEPNVKKKIFVPSGAANPSFAPKYKTMADLPTVARKKAPQPVVEAPKRLWVDREKRYTQNTNEATRFNNLSADLKTKCSGLSNFIKGSFKTTLQEFDEKGVPNARHARGEDGLFINATSFGNRFREIRATCAELGLFALSVLDDHTAPTEQAVSDRIAAAIKREGPISAAYQQLQKACEKLDTIGEKLESYDHIVIKNTLKRHIEDLMVDIKNVQDNLSSARHRQWERVVEKNLKNDGNQRPSTAGYKRPPTAGDSMRNEKPLDKGKSFGDIKRETLDIVHKYLDILDSSPDRDMRMQKLSKAIDEHKALNLDLKYIFDIPEPRSTVTRML